jgi:acetyltransferase-like isoleucine patch superfamily enzyme
MKRNQNISLLSYRTWKFSLLLRGVLHHLGFGKCGHRFLLGKRCLFIRKKAFIIGDHVTIEDNCSFNGLCRGHITIGDRVVIGRGSTIEGGKGGASFGESMSVGNDTKIGPEAFICVRGEITIGSHTLFGERVALHSDNHVFSSPDVLICEQGTTRQGISIGDDCWLGANVVVLDGVHIGSHSVIGAGSVVTKDVPEYAVAVGVPARVIRLRK